MNFFTTKIYLGLLTVGFTTLLIQLVPISKQASSWNRCLRKTSEASNKVNFFRKLNDEDKEVVSVVISNGAVFETKIKTYIQ